MSKDNLLYALFGVLLGFVSGFLMKEAMDLRQPPRRVPGVPLAGDAAPGGGGAPAGMPQQGAGGGAAGPPGAGMPSMEEIEALRDHVAKNPEDADAVIRLAGLNFQIQNWPRARDLFTQYLKLRPEEPDVLSDLGVVYRELGDHQEALAHFDRAQELAPDHWQSRFNEVVVLAFDLQDYAAAEKVIEELKRLQPGNQDVQQLEAEVQRRKAA